MFVSLFQFTAHLEEDYRRASIIAVFIDAVRNDEESSIEPTFANNIILLESELYPFLCQLYTALYDRSITNIPDVTRDAMAPYDRSVGSTAERYSRDYRVLKDTVDIFNSIANGYNFNRNGQNT